MRDTSNENGESRRSAMTKGAVAASALAVGAGMASAQENDDDEPANAEGEVIVHGHDYYPDVEFEVLAELESGTRDDVLESETYADEFDDVGDWDAYAVHFDVGSGGPLGHVFVDDDDADIDPGDTGTMDGSVSIRNAELNLFEVGITTEPGEDEPEDDDEEEDDDAENNDAENDE